MKEICFIDFETTGTDLIDDYPIEIGAILVDSNMNISKEFHSFIKPNNTFKLEKTAFDIHGISELTIMQSPAESTVLRNMFSKLGTSYRLAAWNMSFDVAFFKTMCLRNSFDEYLNKINYRHLDVQTISFIAKEIGCIPNTINSLSELANYFGLSRSAHHSAFEDARILYKVYMLLMATMKNKL